MVSSKLNPKKYMARAPRNIDPAHQYHLMVRGSNKSTVFYEATDYDYYRNLILEAKRKNGVKIYYYALMPNHAHAQIQPTQRSIAGFLHLTQLRYSQYFSKKYEIAGHIWQGHSKAKPIETDAYSIACGTYIEHSPVRANIVKNPEDWASSSYNFYAFGKPDPLIDVDPRYLRLGNTPEERQIRYRQSVGKMRPA